MLWLFLYPKMSLTSSLRFEPIGVQLFPLPPLSDRTAEFVTVDSLPSNPAPLAGLNLRVQRESRNPSSSESNNPQLDSYNCPASLDGRENMNSQCEGRR